jgi:hypothetical protein
MFRSYIEIEGSLVPANSCIVVNNHHCGKPNCKCRNGKLHQSTILKYRVDGKQKVKYLQKSKVESVRKQLYQAKGIEILERADKYIFSIAGMFPELSGADIQVMAYEVFGQKCHNT